VCAEVRVHTVEKGMIALDYVPNGDDWQRVGLSLAGAHNVSGSGVPE
jgi:hypothetical protein